MVERGDMSDIEWFLARKGTERVIDALDFGAYAIDLMLTQEHKRVSKAKRNDRAIELLEVDADILKSFANRLRMAKEAADGA